MFRKHRLCHFSHFDTQSSVGLTSRLTVVALILAWRVPGVNVEPIWRTPTRNWETDTTGEYFQYTDDLLNNRRVQVVRHNDAQSGDVYHFFTDRDRDHACPGRVRGK
ncbi:uncharacterized [Tachysurus ichikawai]